ncbi:MAG TPA: hypothetical protein ENO28_05315 [Bacteroidetes bacterium]|nr:hypothetical protein [Bacteroidota bacterium]
MKLQNKHYFEISMLPVILLPVIVLTIVITLFCNHRAAEPFEPDGHRLLKSYPAEPPKLALYDEAAEQDSDYCEQAIFDFTGDTVLVLKGPAFADVPEGLQKVLYKNKSGTFKITDLPASEMKALEADSAGLGQ